MYNYTHVDVIFIEINDTRQTIYKIHILHNTYMYCTHTELTHSERNSNKNKTKLRTQTEGKDDGRTNENVTGQPKANYVKCFVLHHSLHFLSIIMQTCFVPTTPPSFITPSTLYSLKKKNHNVRAEVGIIIIFSVSRYIVQRGLLNIYLNIHMLR